MTDENITVTRAERRYDIHVGDVHAGYTLFRPDSQGRLVFPHTEIDPAFRGRGLAGRLIAEAMADVAARGETIVPHCPVISKYLREHDVPGLEIAWPTRPHPE